MPKAMAVVPRRWHVGDEEPPVGTRVRFGFDVWIRHPQHRWIIEHFQGSGVPGIEWHQLLEAAAPVGVTEACGSQYVLVPEDRNDSYCHYEAAHDGGKAGRLHVNRAGFAWNDAEAEAAVVEKAIAVARVEAVRDFVTQLTEIGEHNNIGHGTRIFVDPDDFCGTATYVHWDDGDRKGWYLLDGKSFSSGEPASLDAILGYDQPAADRRIKPFTLAFGGGDLHAELRRWIERQKM